MPEMVWRVIVSDLFREAENGKLCRKLIRPCAICSKHLAGVKNFRTNLSVLFRSSFGDSSHAADNNSRQGQVSFVNK